MVSNISRGSGPLTTLLPLALLLCTAQAPLPSATEPPGGPAPIFAPPGGPPPPSATEPPGGPAPTLENQPAPGSMFDAIKWNLQGEALTYGTGLARTSDSPINPGNSFAQIPNLTVTGELRPNLKATSEFIDFIFQPRLKSFYQEGGVQSQESVRAYIQQAFVRARPVDGVTVTVGRELLTWGPAFFRSPSNPYYFNNARLDPIVELSGLDLARVSYGGLSNWVFSGGVIFDSGQDLVPNDPYRDSILLTADYSEDRYLGKLVFASLRSRQAFFGGYIQATVNDAILVYGEVGSTNSNTGPDLLPPGYTDGFTPDSTGDRKATALIGGSYTFLNGQSVYAEYLYNGFGFDGSGLRRYFSGGALASSQLAAGGSLVGASVEDLAWAATRSENLLGQHYLYLQYQNNPTQGDTLWRLMVAENLIDHSAQFSAYLEHTLTDRVSVFGLGVVNAGNRNTEFGALFGESLMLGLKFFLF